MFDCIDNFREDNFKFEFREFSISILSLLLLIVIISGDWEDEQRSAVESDGDLSRLHPLWILLFAARQGADRQGFVFKKVVKEDTKLHILNFE